MNCRQADKWIDQSLDEALHPAQKVRLETHLESCPRCRREWEVLRAADVALRAPRPVRAPEGMLAEFRQRVAQEEAHRELRHAPRHTPWPWFWPVASFAAAGAAAAVVIGFNLLPSQETVQSPVPAPRPEVMAKSGRGRAPEISGSGPALPAPVEPRVPKVRAGADRRPGPGNPAGAAIAKAAPPVIRTPVFPDAAAGAQPAPVSPRMAAGERRRNLPGNSTRLFLEAGPAAATAPGSSGGARERARFTQPEREVPRIAADHGPLLAGRGPEGPATGPVALGLEVQEVQSALLPPEFNVSPAVLTALRRDVEVKVETTPVREALKQITEAADVVVRVDDSVQPLRVTVEQEGAPLWVALQSVARQGRLQIVAEENQLVLRPAAKEEKMEGGAPPLVRSVRKGAEAAPAPPQSLGKVNSALKPPVPPVPAAPAARGQAGPVPDRTVWPATWGTLPERGFQPPAPEELPPSVANLPQAMDEARENNRSYYLNQQLNNQKAKLGDVKRDGRKAP